MIKEIENKVEKPFKDGYYLEAFGQIDIMIDRMLFGLLNYQVHYDKLSYLLQKYGRLTGFNLSTILKELKVIKKDLCDDIKKFKEFRNRIAHDYISEAAIVLFSNKIKQASKDEKKRLVGIEWENVYKTEMDEHKKLGINIINKLDAILSTLPPIYIDPKIIEEEIKDIYEKN